MRGMYTLLWVLLLWNTPAWAQAPQVEFQTDAGSFVIELYPDKSPLNVANFIAYVNDGFYNGTVFHRAVKGFVLQGGGLDPNLKHKQTREPVVLESNNGLEHLPGTVAIARGESLDSATSQFFINLTHNRFLSFQRMEPGYAGYTIVGRVIRGLDVVERMAATPTTVNGRLKDVPLQPPLVMQASVLSEPVMADIIPVPVAEVEKPAKPKKKAPAKTVKPTKPATP
ncbi:peptidylprolyl isomerase [Methylobacillus flagellatus]|uniref:peptidylprolyl isomerase n=1 Tax=Methylobacillus flagellatus TaxID=405 RepID=UPI0010F9DF83|nr:peptidylprolyl isomerase [Methylobacillus flagellatus]